MNIISGSLKGRRIIYDKKLNVRPTTSKSKEGVFNTLNNLYDWSKIRVLDLFSGSGNISYEFASRGVNKIYFVDNIGLLRLLPQLLGNFADQGVWKPMWF